MNVNSTTQMNHFDRAKPFYPLVMNYLIQLIGFKTLSERGIIGPPDSKGFIEKLGDRLRQVEDAEKKLIDDGAQIEGVFDESKGEIRENLQIISDKLSKLAGPLQLKSEFQGNHITINIDEIAKEVLSNHSYLISFLMRAAGSLLILTHEICKDKPYHNQNPIWEFLRHCRNAAAHGGLFNLQHGEPRRLAEWGSFRIEPRLQGVPLFKDGNGVGFLSPGDPIRLLWDIEQQIPI